MHCNVADVGEVALLKCSDTERVKGVLGTLGGPKNCDLTNMMEYRHDVYQNHPNNTETHWNTSSHKICISVVGSKNHS